jgi:hypothetical protein
MKKKGILQQIVGSNEDLSAIKQIYGQVAEATTNFQVCTIALDRSGI